MPDAAVPRAGLVRQLPNALTVLRLIAIPFFIVLLWQAEGGHSLAAGILFMVHNMLVKTALMMGGRRGLRRDRRAARARPLVHRSLRARAGAASAPAKEPSTFA